MSSLARLRFQWSNRESPTGADCKFPILSFSTTAQTLSSRNPRQFFLLFASFVRAVFLNFSVSFFWFFTFLVSSWFSSGSPSFFLCFYDFFQVLGLGLAPRPSTFLGTTQWCKQSQKLKKSARQATQLKEHLGQYIYVQLCSVPYTDVVH